MPELMPLGSCREAHLLAGDGRFRAGVAGGMTIESRKHEMKNGSLSNVSVLCIDNHIDSLEFLKLVLELEGAQVFTAVSAEESMRVLATHQPDVVISDLAMPNGDGISLLETIRN